MEHHGRRSALRDAALCCGSKGTTKVVVNGTPSLIKLGVHCGTKIKVLKIMPVTGSMNGLREMVLLPKSDLEARLDLMQTAMVVQAGIRHVSGRHVS